MDRKVIYEKTLGLRNRLIELGKTVRSWMPIVYIMQYIARFETGFLLARAVIFGTYAPFGIAFCAGCGIGINGIFGIIGAVFGYLSILYRANGLKYIAICVLVYTAGFVFRDTVIYKKRWFMPLAATISSAAIGFVFVADSGFGVDNIALYIAEVCIITLCTYFYQICFSKKHGEIKLEAVSKGILLVTLIIPLASIKIWGSISIGRAIATLVIMLAGYYGGAGVASVAGIVLGTAICTGNTEIYLCAVYGVCGLLTSVFRLSGKLIYAIAYIIINAVSILWFTMKIELPFIYETFFASVLFLPICELFGNAIKEELAPTIARENYADRVRSFAQIRLTNAAKSFNQLAHTVESAFKHGSKGEENIASVFNAPVQQICKKCMLSGNCWEHEYVMTRGALNDATKAMRDRGKLLTSDFPMHFSSRCIRLEEFVAAVNQELIRFMYREQCKARINESRNMVKQQYREMSEIFRGFAHELAADPHFDEEAEGKLCEFLRGNESDAIPWVYRDINKRLRVQIEGEQVEKLCDNLKSLHEYTQEILKVPMTYPSVSRNEKNTCISMHLKEPINATIGVAVHKKRGCEISGDSGSYFRMEDGKLCVILADGMGSGKEAAVLSASAISLLERFLQSGIAPKMALKMINSALILKGEEESGFTTIDFLQLDLYTGSGEVYKLGSAPSYIKRGYSVKRLCGNALPAGVPCKKTSESDCMHHKFAFGDFAIFATDGIADKNDDEWLVEMISEFDGTSAKQLATEIMAGACAKYGFTDDMSVVVLRVDKNE